METDAPPAQFKEHEDPYSPFFLTPADNAISGAVTTILNGTNYHNWSSEMDMSLSVKNKFGFVDGSVTKPPETEIQKMKAWKRCNTLVKSWILHSVSPEIKSTILYVESPKEIWDKLKTRYEQPQDVRVYKLQQDLDKFKQGSLCVSVYFTKLNGMWEELNNYNPIPTCTCGHCQCETASNLEYHFEKIKIFKF